MVHYVDDSIFPAPRDAVWKLLDGHLDDAGVHSIHPLILAQRTVQRSPTESIVERTIDARGKSLPSTWKITYDRPNRAAWEITGGSGPWAPGTRVETVYSEVPGGTRMQTQGDLQLLGVPAIARLFSGGVVKSVFNQTHEQDVAWLSAHP